MKEYIAGIDVGSTTTKIAVVDPQSEEIIYYDYRRHSAAQIRSIYDTLNRAAEALPDISLRIAFTGSGAKPAADLLGVPFVQEVVANSIALRRLYADVGTAIELGGQDAKMLFFRHDQNGQLEVSDMRMNGSCAGGTGAFIDEVGSILKIPIEQFNDYASRGECVYDISGRCGVFAKTDIQPLLNQGVSKENLALSGFHAIAKQTIGGLAQGLEITKPVIFEGGPLHFNPRLIEVFAERLALAPEDILIPEHPEVIVAYGAALSLKGLYADKDESYEPADLARELAARRETLKSQSSHGKKYFENEQEYKAFKARTRLPEVTPYDPAPGEVVKVWLGIDSGSTTTKFVFMDDDENLLEQFYSPNNGNPLIVAKRALLSIKERYEKAGASLEILGVGSTGYGELLFNKAFKTECHMVETVAHARAAEKYVDGVSFILDIGGQDMKGIWINQGVITNIVVNEACSSGCGSFLENFAASLHIPVMKIAQTAFDSQAPAELGSRCTVFMNSSIITEQRNGKQPGDIMAGLCRSIINNVFTKVIRISNVQSLGSKIVVQGGTFNNDAVLRAMEQYIGREVTRAPYPGIMGAIGAALLTKERMSGQKIERSFIGMEALRDFSFTQEANQPCPFCANHCKRTIVRFSTGDSWITNNRCERGEILGDPSDQKVKDQLKQKREQKQQTPNLYELRKELLFKEYPVQKLTDDRDITIGLPRVLAYWDNMPFWSTFWRALGFKIRMSPYSTRKIYEDGLQSVTSDTVCFPAKLVHGHLRWLAKHGADRIWMPSVTVVPPENTDKHSESMCAVVKGYPIVIRNSDNPQDRFGIPFDAPLFHWYTSEDRERQLSEYMEKVFGISRYLTVGAILEGDIAMDAFRTELRNAGEKVLADVKAAGKYAILLAARPYQNDALVNHDLPELFAGMGIPVIPADALEKIEKIDLHRTRIDVVNNFHARMLSSAMIAAREEALEYVQVVSFGCGHDAYLSDEIIRLMKEISGKTPLVLKLDESDVQGPLRIRVRSFIETIEMNRARGRKLEVHPIPDPYPVKYTKEDREKILLVPNTSHAFSRLMSAAFAGQHIKTVPLEIGRQEAIELGKRYVHNDICFPAQIVIGEILSALKSGQYDPDHTAVAMGKYVGDCRLTHYGALLRKALDDAGFSQIPILTNDEEDYRNMHPGFRIGMQSSIRIAAGLPMIDAMEELLRKMRPYETKKGAAEYAFEKGMDRIIDGMAKGGIPGALKGFEKAIAYMKRVPYDRSMPRPTVLIVGEYLLNFHPGANRDIEKYLEKNGLEVVEAKMTDVIRKTYFYKDRQVKEYHLHNSLKEKTMLHIYNSFFNLAHDMTDRIACRHPLYHKAVRMQDLVKDSDPIIHHTFDAGEGVLIPGEILHNAKEGCRNFIILQPFGCLPNHVVGRGIMRKLKEMYPDAQILPLDYDPDVSQANIENRLQMLIMNAL